MNTYRAQFMGGVPRGWDRLDTLARVISIVSSLTIVDKTWSNMQGHTLTVGIVFQGLNDNEARETVRRVLLDLPGSYDVLLDVYGRHYERIPAR
jgi:hypothetical protein